jgi:hypothetical protein
MKGLSKDIEIAVDTVIEGLEYETDMSLVDADKVKTIVKAKVDSFKYGKELLLRWQNSNNAPNDDTLKKYVKRLIKAGDIALDVLRKALRTKIDYDDLDPSKHHLAISVKPSIHQAIIEIDSALIELRLQLDADNINLKENEFKRGYPEKFASGEFLPLKDYYKEWYDKENDAIILDPKGTMGEVISVGDLKIVLPKVPSKKEILFHNLKKEDQFWRRQEEPKGLSQDTAEAYTEYIIEEFRRRREGIWFMNNGKAEYLTGTHYFALQWVKMEDSGGYMDFRFAQRDMFYFTQACIVDDRCLGELFVKSRRTGYTYQILCQLLNDATSVSNARLGITSKSNDDAEKAFSKLSYGFLNLPFFFKPVVKGVEDSKKFLEFAKPSDRTKTGKKKKDTNTDDYLNTLVDFLPTKNDSYDGQKMFRYLGDEASKWTRPANFEKHWGQVSPTFDTGGRIVGKAFIGSTVAAMKDGGEEYFELYKSSLIRKRNKITGRTPSGLYTYFLPAHKNMEEFTDKYGVCHEVADKNNGFYNVQGQWKTIGSVQFLEAKRSSKKKESDISYNEELRAFPMTIDEAFRDELSQSTFNVEKILSQIKINEDHEIEKTLVRGNFQWENGVRDTKVEWYPTEKGRFLVSWIPPVEMRNKFEWKNIFGDYSRHPSNENIGAFGCDPYDISTTVDGVKKDGSYSDESSRGSKGALHGLTGTSFSDAPNNTFFLEYVERPKTAEIFFEDVLMACVFYGMPILAENNKPRLLYHFKNRGYRGFSVTRPGKAENRLSPTEKELGGMPNSSEDVIQMHAAAIESYIEKYVGESEDGEIYTNMPFTFTLNDWKKFDVRNRTKYDASISSGLAIIAVNRKMYQPRKKDLTDITINLRLYNK